MVNRTRLFNSISSRCRNYEAKLLAVIRPHEGKGGNVMVLIALCTLLLWLFWTKIGGKPAPGLCPTPTVQAAFDTVEEEEAGLLIDSIRSNIDHGDNFSTPKKAHRKKQTATTPDTVDENDYSDENETSFDPLSNIGLNAN